MKPGDKVKFIAATDDQVNWGSNDDPRLILKKDKNYEIAYVEMHSWHTKINLVGIGGWFNSVSFEKVEDKIDVIIWECNGYLGKRL